ncbi:MAG TPA: hypothetical protein VHB25_16475 [Gemmatimonadaceae bacterium]|nr:hypothetical protein [Gemmatimonadaceae bacterium]
MAVVRRISLLIGAALLGTAVLIGWVRVRPSMSPNAARELADASAYFDSTLALARDAQPRGPRGDQLAIALGYLERLRLGLGDPFRLIDEALDDPRVSAGMRTRLAWALLARLRRGDAYVVPPTVLDGLGPWDNAGTGATGAAHLALIERTIRDAPDPRAGELTVRLSYMLAAAAGTVSPAAVSVATNAAALIRDRQLAIRDANDVLADAVAHREDVLALLQSRRAARALAVEAPTLAPLSSALRVAAIDAVPRTLAALDTLERATEAAALPAADSSLIGPAFAARLDTLGARRPPMAPIVITLASHHAAGLGATNEETLVSVVSLTRAAAADSARRALDRAVLASAVALRPFAQEAPWFEGDPAPAASDVAAEFGLASVTFTRDVPERWRPYYLRELAHALDDMGRVFPAASFAGLRVRFTAATLADSALALHDPRTRTLHLSVATSAGTIAHELTHDLDWQSARRLFTDGGGYGTDRAARERRGPLAASVQGLAESRSSRAYAVGGAPRTDRPAELFARSTDWFVASALAAQGRMDGFLSAVQDAMLAGYAAGSPTIAGRRAGTALLSALDEMTLIPDSSRSAFEHTWADAADIDPAMLVRRVLDTPVPWRAVTAATAAGAEDDAASWDGGALPAAVCTPNDDGDMRARRALIAMAVEARARGIAKHWARRRLARAPAEWASSLLGVPPWAPGDGAPVVAELRDAIARAVVGSPENQGVVPAVPPIFRSSASNCSVIAR